MKSTMNLEEHNEMKDKIENNMESEDKIKKVDKDFVENKKSKKIPTKSSNNGAFRNNYKNYQYDYEEDYYEPY